MITYVEDTSGWEQWQRDYRLGVILILPPPHIAQQIDPLRAKYDSRSFETSPTHISVSDPLSKEMTPAIEEEIRGVMSTINPFELHFDKPQASTEYAGVSYPIRPQAPIDALKKALHALSAFGGRSHERRSIPAHMTIAEFLSVDESLELCDQLQGSAPSGSFVCDRLSLVVPDKEFSFNEVAVYVLGATQ